MWRTAAHFEKHELEGLQALVGNLQFHRGVQGISAVVRTATKNFKNVQMEVTEK